MAIRITLTQIGTNITDPLAIYTSPTGLDGSWTLYGYATKNDLLFSGAGGYVLTGTTGSYYKVEDIGSCTLPLILTCSGGTPITTTTTTSGLCYTDTLSLGYNVSDASGACYATPSTIYANGTFTFSATRLYSDTICTYAATGYYSNGTSYRYWNSSIPQLSSVQTCALIPGTTTTTTSSLLGDCYMLEIPGVDLFVGLEWLYLSYTPFGGVFGDYKVSDMPDEGGYPGGVQIKLCTLSDVVNGSIFKYGLSGSYFIDTNGWSTLLSTNSCSGDVDCVLPSSPTTTTTTTVLIYSSWYVSWPASITTYAVSTDACNNINVDYSLGHTQIVYAAIAQGGGSIDQFYTDPSLGSNYFSVSPTGQYLGYTDLSNTTTYYVNVIDSQSALNPGDSGTC